MPQGQASKTAVWRYKGVTTDGTRRQQGTVEAATQDQAIARITKLGIIPTEVVNTAEAKGLNMEIGLGFTKYPSKKDFAVMSRQLATMVTAGVSLTRALGIVVDQTPNQKLRDSLRHCLTDIEGGKSFSDSMQEQSDVFPAIMIYMVRAGETGGFLDGALNTIASSFEADVRLQQQIKSAMAYPIVVLCIALLLVGVMLLTIVPTFKNMYDSMGAELPAVTKVLVAMGQAAPIAIPVLVIAIVVFAVWWRRNRKEVFIRRWWEPFQLKAPVFGKLNTNVALARFCRNFSSMLLAGVPITDALDIVGSTSGNYTIENATRTVSTEIQKGRRLADSMAMEPVFPNMMVQMVAIGEDSGAVDQMLDNAGRAYDEEAQSIAKQLTSLLEPIMILVLGVIVGFMVIALYMPMFDMFNAIDKM